MRTELPGAKSANRARDRAYVFTPPHTGNAQSGGRFRPPRLLARRFDYVGKRQRFSAPSLRSSKPTDHCSNTRLKTRMGVGRCSATIRCMTMPAESTKSGAKQTACEQLSQWIAPGGRRTDGLIGKSRNPGTQTLSTPIGAKAARSVSGQSCPSRPMRSIYSYVTTR